MLLSFKCTSSLDKVSLPPSIFLMGESIPIVRFDEKIIQIDTPGCVGAKEVIQMLLSMTGSKFAAVEELPGQFGADQTAAEEEIGRILEEQEKAISALRAILEPTIEININDPQLESLTPIGRLIWDSVFIKPAIVPSLSQWLNTTQSDEAVYLPNDGSKLAPDMEEAVSNAMYTEVLTNAYRAMCARVGIAPKVILCNGEILNAAEVIPFDGAQHTMPGERSSRLANSKLIDFDDSEYARDFIQCICDLTPDQFEKEPIRRRVLAKVEHILMGRSSHTYNQRFIHALYEYFVSDIVDVPWAAHRVPMTNCVMGILKQMVVEGMVLEDNKYVFLGRLKAMGFSEYEEAVAKVYDEAGERGRTPQAQE